jgi:hypothetical protein
VRYSQGRFSPVLVAPGPTVQRILTITGTGDTLWFRDFSLRLFRWRNGQLTPVDDLPETHRRSASWIDAGKSGTLVLHHGQRQATGALGRPLRNANRTIDILEPFSMFGERLRQLDLRASRLFRVGARRFQLNVDLYNAMNGSTPTFIRNTYTAPGAVTTTPWLQPTQVQDGRFWKFSVQHDF